MAHNAQTKSREYCGACERASSQRLTDAVVWAACRNTKEAKSKRAGKLNIAPHLADVHYVFSLFLQNSVHLLQIRYALGWEHGRIVTASAT